MNQALPETNGLNPVRCSNCGRFLGYEMMMEGVVFIRCGNCKQFNQVITPNFDIPLTEEVIYDTLTRRKRTKGQEGH